VEGEERFAFHSKRRKRKRAVGKDAPSEDLAVNQKIKLMRKHKKLIPPRQKKLKIKELKIMSTQITILGNTGRDVELRYTPQGTAVANFSVASNTVRNTAEGQKKKTDWFNVSAFGRQAETLAKYLTKGSMILVRGKLTFNPWLSRDGEARVSADIVLQDFEFAGASPSRSNNESASAAVSTQQEAGSEIALPQAEADAEEKAEMMAVLEEMNSSDEPFAGQF